MARTRQVKPEFFTDEKLWQSDDLTILLFEALWCLADREGRLQDNIIFIHGNCLPHRPKAKVDDMLNSLHSHEFITRYSRNGCKYIQINNFTKHQNLHPNEKESLIPCINREEIANESRTVHSPSTSSFVPSFPSLPSGSTDAPAANADHLSIQQSWNLFAESVGLARINTVTLKRKKAIKLRLAQDGFSEQEIYDKIRESKFLLGDNDRGWRCDFDFVWGSPDNWVKIVEGKYDNTKGSNNSVGGAKTTREDLAIYDQYTK